MAWPCMVCNVGADMLLLLLRDSQKYTIDCMSAVELNENLNLLSKFAKMECPDVYR